jgi:uncharacterized protein (TIGR02284 family)
MTNDTSEVTSLLNDLIETCRDGQEGFQQAAEGVQDTQLKSLFMQYSQQRAQFASELQSQVRLMGGNPENTGSVAGAAHRGWINIKAAVTGKDDDAIISECERGEDVAKASYEKALQQTLPADVQAIVTRQAAQVREAHDRVRALEKAHHG